MPSAIFCRNNKTRAKAANWFPLNRSTCLHAIDAFSKHETRATACCYFYPLSESQFRSANTMLHSSTGLAKRAATSYHWCMQTSATVKLAAPKVLTLRSRETGMRRPCQCSPLPHRPPNACPKHLRAKSEDNQFCLPTVVTGRHFASSTNTPRLQATAPITAPQSARWMIIILPLPLLPL